jgi:hypothetical protein
MRSHQPFVRWITPLCLLALLAPTASGSFTQINPPHPGEDTHQQILSNVYGGTFLPFGAEGVDFSNGSILAKRVHDVIENRPGGPQEMGGPTGGEDDSDQLWRALFQGATAEAKFAEFEQNFGYFPGASGGSYIQLFSVSGNGYNVSGEVNIPSLADTTLRWGRGGQGRVVSSLIADNQDNEDHMVTYQILSAPDGGEVQQRWLILFEDIFRGEPFADFDFNDLAVEITAIPEPSGLAVCAMLGAALARRRRD